MNENPQESKESPESEEKTTENSNWSEDQKNHKYYYDDACDYEVYDADEDADEKE